MQTAEIPGSEWARDNNRLPKLYRDLVVVSI